MLRSVANLFVWRAALYASLGAALAGYYDGSMNGILEMEGFYSAFHHLHGNDPAQNASESNSTDSTCISGHGTASDLLIGTVVSISALGSSGGSLLAGWLSDQLSRKYGLVISGSVVTLGALMLSVSNHIGLFVFGRIICGFSIGIIYMVMPIYISEVTPKSSRGMFGALIGIYYAGGVLTALCSNVGFSKFLQGWRVATSIQALLGLLFALGMMWMPHSPRWLVLKHREKEAHFILSEINHCSKEDRCVVDTYFELEELKEATGQRKAPFKEVLRWKYFSRLLLMFGLFFIYTGTGNFIYFFSASLFCGVGVSPFYASLAVGFIMLFASFILPAFIDKIGRKSLLLCGSTLCMLLAVLAATLIVLFDDQLLIVVVAIICIYAFTNSTTWLTIPIVINSEIFPIHVRDITVALTTSAYWFFSFLVNQAIPLSLSSVRVQGLLYIVAGINLISIVLVAFALPETKGVSLEHMDKLFSGNPCGKTITKASCLLRRSRELQVSNKTQEISNLKSAPQS